MYYYHLSFRLFTFLLFLHVSYYPAIHSFSFSPLFHLFSLFSHRLLSPHIRRFLIFYLYLISLLPRLSLFPYLFVRSHLLRISSPIFVFHGSLLVIVLLSFIPFLYVFLFSLASFTYPVPLFLSLFVVYFYSCYSHVSVFISFFFFQMIYLDFLLFDLSLFYFINPSFVFVLSPCFHCLSPSSLFPH